MKDLIFNNSYNTSEFDNEDYNAPNIVLDKSSIQQNIETDHPNFDRLQLEILSLFEDSKFKNVDGLQKRWNSYDIFLYFYDIYESQIQKNEISCTEFVLSLIETFDLNYDITYQTLPEIIKYKLKKEMGFGTNDKNKKKLF